MGKEEIALTHRVCGSGSVKAVARMLFPVAPIEIECNPTSESFSPNSENLATFAVEYVKMYREI